MSTETADFFDVETYPTALFESDCRMTGEETAKVTGNLTLHDPKPVILDVELNKIGENMFGKKTAGFSATTAIKRSDFGMTTYLLVLAMK